MHTCTHAHVHARQGWNTGAIIKELEDEISAHETELYRTCKIKAQAINLTLRMLQADVAAQPPHALLDDMETERAKLRTIMSRIHNPHFGSAFRTDANATLFGFRVGRYADIYTSRVENLLHYPLTYRFYPQSRPLSHEPRNVSQRVSEYLTLETDELPGL